MAVFRNLRDLSGLNDLLNVLQSLLVRRVLQRGTQQPPHGAYLGLPGSKLNASPSTRITGSLQPPRGVGITIAPILQMGILKREVRD